MDELESTITKSRTGLVVGIVVVAGIAVLALGGYLAWSKRQAPAAATVPKGANQWCQLRQEWNQQVKPLAGEIMLKMVSPAEAEAYQALVQKRRTICKEYADKLAALLKESPTLWTTVQKVEEALIKEGKVRANVAVQIANTLTQVSETTSEKLRKNETLLQKNIKTRIAQGKVAADQEVQAALSGIQKLSCPGIYRGPMTDKGTTGDPFTTWKELEVKRTLALKEFERALKALEPLEQFTNRVYHDLMTRHRGDLARCYQKIKKRNPEMSDKMGLQVRLKKTGKVKTLGIGWMVKPDERILDCLLETAGKWRLPKPEEGMDVVVVSLDFAAL